jgi:hypothetical protein
MVLGSGLVFGWRASAAGGSPWYGIPLLALEGAAGTLALLLVLGKIPVLRVLSPMTKTHGDSAGPGK